MRSAMQKVEDELMILSLKHFEERRQFDLKIERELNALKRETLILVGIALLAFGIFMYSQFDTVRTLVITSGNTPVNHEGVRQ